jgi:hypothetical protein
MQQNSMLDLTSSFYQAYGCSCSIVSQVIGLDSDRRFVPLSEKFPYTMLLHRGRDLGIISFLLHVL